MKHVLQLTDLAVLGVMHSKIAFDRSDIEVVAINDLTSTNVLAYLLKHDSNYGTYDHQGRLRRASHYC